MSVVPSMSINGQIFLESRKQSKERYACRPADIITHTNPMNMNILLNMIDIKFSNYL